jgi:hypothetical protein
LIDEINVEPPIAIDVCDGQSGSVIVVSWLPGFERVLDARLLKSDPALDCAIGKLELVKGFEVGRGLNLFSRTILQHPRHRSIGRRIMDNVGDVGGKRAQLDKAYREKCGDARRQWNNATRMFHESFPEECTQPKRCK